MSGLIVSSRVKRDYILMYVLSEGSEKEVSVAELSVVGAYDCELGSVKLRYSMVYSLHHIRVWKVEFWKHNRKLWYLLTTYLGRGGQ